MGNRYRLAVYAVIGALTWWSHRERAHQVELEHEYEQLCARPW